MFSENYLLDSAALQELEGRIACYFSSGLLHHQLITPEGLVLSAVENHPACPRFHLLIVPGRGECEYKYAELLYCLEQIAIHAAVAFVRGQGCSSSTLPGTRRTHIERFAAYREDLAFIIRELAMPPVLAMLGFSLGGLIALDYVVNGGGRPARLALIAPFIYPCLPAGGGAAVCLIHLGSICMKNCLVATQSDYRYVEFAENHHTHCELRYRLYHAYYARHPDRTPGGITYAFLHEALLVQNRLMHDPRPLPVPVLCQYAALDCVVSSKHTIAYMQVHRRPDDLPAVAIPGSFHDVLNEQDDIRNPALYRAISFLFGSK